ncbi:hypothetical protein RF11_06298 [Thelohanellus kitauei]|uniref:Uncharacterized protein n=1 Tax=Thelohanellus kitauei TaxID=669202 RepID=A0A0C2N2I7_THEKT|nr:hypothetical protein RF11_06298 [Thelohanellus kitauei]
MGKNYGDLKGTELQLRGNDETKSLRQVQLLLNFLNIRLLDGLSKPDMNFQENHQRDFDFNCALIHDNWASIRDNPVIKKRDFKRGKRATKLFKDFNKILS